MGDNIRPKPSYNIGQEPLEAIRDTKVSVNSTDEPGYLESKIDGVTIKVSPSKKIYASSLGIGVVTQHNDLDGKQGGDGVLDSEFYHLTSAQHTIATQAAAVDKAGYVDLTTQTFTGVKTFANSPIVPDATSTKEAAAYGQVVNLTAAQTVAGIKTFSSFPIAPLDYTGIATQNLITKKYADDKFVPIVGVTLLYDEKVFDKFPQKNYEEGSEATDLVPTLDEQLTTKYYVDAKTYAHNDTASKQGGTTSEYFHLTAAEHTIATQAASDSVAGYVTTGAQNIAGVKTFNNFPKKSGSTTDLVPTALGEFATKYYVDDQIIAAASTHNNLSGIQGGGIVVPGGFGAYHLNKTKYDFIQDNILMVIKNFTDLNNATKVALAEAGNWTGNIGSIVTFETLITLPPGLVIISTANNYKYTVYGEEETVEGLASLLIRTPIDFA
jgi:hypothetical protein